MTLFQSQQLELQVLSCWYMTGCGPPKIIAAFHDFAQDATVETACNAGAFLNASNIVDAHLRFDHID